MNKKTCDHGVLLAVDCAACKMALVDRAITALDNAHSTAYDATIELLLDRCAIIIGLATKTSKP